MDLNLIGMKTIISEANVGYIPAELIGILAVIIIAIIMYKGQNKQKIMISLAPLSILMGIIGFNITGVFLILVFLLFGILTFIGSEFKENVIEQ